MMQLNVEKYCENCPDFEAVTNKLDRSYRDGKVCFLTVDGKVCFLAIVRCENSDRCREIQKHIMKCTEQAQSPD